MRGSTIWFVKFIVIGLILLLVLKWRSVFLANQPPKEVLRQFDWLIATATATLSAAVLLITPRNIILVVVGVPIILACIAMGFVVDCVAGSVGTELGKTWILPPLAG